MKLTRLAVVITLTVAALHTALLLVVVHVMNGGL